MLTVDFQNLFQTQAQDPKHGISEEDFTSWESKFESYKELVLSRKQGFLDLGNQPENLEKISAYSKSVESKFTDIVILGIGGSMLGPLTILEALNRTPKANTPKVHCLDNIDPVLIQEITDKINLQKTLILVQTKSGGTPETLAQYFYFKDLLQKANLNLNEHFVFVTDPENGYLKSVAIKEGIQTFDIPGNVGGRFSVLTPVGLLVSSLVGLDINKLLEGAKDAKEKFFDEGDFSAYKLAVTQSLLSMKGKNITVFMPYSSQLKTLANWYTQLLSESVGKKFNLTGKEVNTGVTPLPALGATDQHSQLQLFQEGTHDKLVVFVEIEKFASELKIPSLWSTEDNLDYLKNKTFNKLIQAEFEGTRSSLTESLRPNITIKLDQINEYTLGELFMFLEISVAFLGEILNIDTYNQPGVERSKILARQILSKAS
ncbi:MAG: glucose-6-phosphate isomerase [bacterium]